MISAYSQRLLPPYTSCVQIAQSEQARAESIDGLNWEIFILPDDLDSANRKQGYGVERGFRVAHLDKHELRVYELPASVNQTQARASIDELATFLSTAKVPFPAADVYEYWLLDGQDESPIALIHSCCEPSLMASFPVKNQWTALPDSKMPIDKTAEELETYEAPVNHRLETLIRGRAGMRPKAAWFQRSKDDGDDFPPLLVTEDWKLSHERELCQRYIQRKAPRLLMLQGIPVTDRERLEVASKQNALEVAEYFQMYPETHNEELMTALRVEARLRRSLSIKSSKKQQAPASDRKRLSKDQRIFDT